MDLPEAYLTLCSRVRKIDTKAADWMVFEAPKNDGWDFDPKDRIGRCFMWAATPQGLQYWDNLESLVHSVFVSNIIDPSLVEDYINTPDGEKAILNFIRRKGYTEESLDTDDQYKVDVFEMAAACAYLSLIDESFYGGYDEVKMRMMDDILELVEGDEDYLICLGYVLIKSDIIGRAINIFISPSSCDSHYVDVDTL